MFKVMILHFASGNVYSVKHSAGTSVKGSCLLIDVSLRLQQLRSTQVKM